MTSASMYQVALTRGHETRLFSIRDTTAGWELIEAANHRTVRTVSYTDWHRVERAIALIEIDAVALERDGWSRIP